MKVYSVTPMEDSLESTTYFATKAQAFAAARQVAEEGTEATVDCDEIRPGKSRELFVALLNRVGYSVSSEEIKVFPAKEITLD